MIGTDPETDLAVLKIELDRLPAITLGNSDALQVGDQVLAIGNPFGVGQTVTSGIVSALGRNQLGINTFENFIQTDAAINPGNSGGALVDVNGQLMGINTAIYSRSGGSMGIGFAIPVSTAKQVLEGIVKEGVVRRGWIGVEPADLSPDLMETFGVKARHGVLVTGVLQSGPAAQAGLRPGDVIVDVNGKPIGNVSELLTLVAALKPGAPAAFKVQRRDERLELNVDARRAAAPARGERSALSGATRPFRPREPSSGAREALTNQREADDADLVQDHHRDRQGQLRDHVRRRHDRRDDERDHDEVAAELLELLDRHHVEAHQQHHHDRHLEGQAERDVQRQDGFHVGGDVGRGGHALRREALDEAEHPVQHEELHERDAGIGQHAARTGSAAGRSASRGCRGPARRTTRPGTSARAAPASTATISSTFSGTKNGENTPTAISLASGGMWARIGCAMKSINPLGPGQIARAITARTMP